MTRQRPRRGEDCPAADRLGQVQAEIVGRRDEMTGVVRVRATFASNGYVRTAEAFLQDKAAALSFMADLQVRVRQGLDPLAGMDPVECREQGGRGTRSASPRFTDLARGE